MSISTPSMQQLLEAGVHFGHQVRRGHPKMRDYIFGVREGVHIINLEHSEKLLQEAAEYANKLGKEGKVLLFVGTKKQAQPIVKEVSEKAGAPYINYRWIGGFLTNFDEIKKNIRKLKDLKEKKEKGELTHYTKKEQLLISRKLEKFEREWGGIGQMDQLPDAIFIIDCVVEKTALAEANRMNIPVIGLADTNCNPYLLTYSIPSNDDATKSIRIITDTIADAYKEGVSGVKAEKAKAVAKEEKLLEEETVATTISDEVAAAEEIIEQKSVKEADRAA